MKTEIIIITIITIMITIIIIIIIIMIIIRNISINLGPIQIVLRAYNSQPMFLVSTNCKRKKKDRINK